MNKRFLFFLISGIFLAGLALGFAGERPYQVVIYNKDGSKSTVWTNRSCEQKTAEISKNYSSKDGVFYYYAKPRPRAQQVMPKKYSYSGRTYTHISPVYVNYYGANGSFASRGKSSYSLDMTAFIENEARKYNIDPLLVMLLIKHESNFNPNAVSGCGAMGLMQLMPATAQSLGVADPYDPYANVAGGTRYFAGQLERFGDLELALAAYNAGPGAVRAWGGIPAYPETVNYVNSILAEYNRIRGVYR